MTRIKDGKIEWEIPVLVKLGGANKAVGQCEPFGSGALVVLCLEFGLSPEFVACFQFGGGYYNNAH